jgi:hypothetical protein
VHAADQKHAGNEFVYALAPVAQGSNYPAANRRRMFMKRYLGKSDLLIALDRT